ncbi:MAG: SGNH/GDSL hydrolase family protein [Elusimicrobiota bacterium]|nr:SGNH/GDSL hydrolase family protein [Endomicrobiia bacterium]MDW8164972.1 SGNH/GDSL hydrolase family protein [Elusimicrobiota bacterium]
MIFDFNKKILFQGDSITDSNRLTTSHGLGEGYVFIVVSWLKTIYYEIECFNRGISGNTVLDLLNRWEKDCISLQPDIISILIGINDSTQGVSNETYKENYEKILKLSKEKLKNPYFILMEPFILEVNSFHKMLKKSVEEKCEIIRELSKKFNCILVPLNEVFKKLSKIKSPQYWAEDGIHPTPQGHFIIAREFLKATKVV